MALGHGMSGEHPGVRIGLAGWSKAARRDPANFPRPACFVVFDNTASSAALRNASALPGLVGAPAS